MKIVQKLEFSAGIATFIATLLYIYFVDLPASKGVAELYHEPFSYNWTRGFLVLIVPSLLVAVSSYFHAFNNNYIGLAVIILLSGLITASHLLSFLLGSAFEGHLLIGNLRAIFAFLTIILAVCNTIYIERKKSS